MLEKEIERKACKWAKENGWLPYKFTSPAHRSVPDRIFVRNGIVAFIEFKRPGERLTAGQIRELDRLRGENVWTAVAYSVEEAQRFLQAVGTKASSSPTSTEPLSTS
jgi:hypothetical protein